MPATTSKMCCCSAAESVRPRVVAFLDILAKNFHLVSKMTCLARIIYIGARRVDQGPAKNLPAQAVHNAAVGRSQLGSNSGQERRAGLTCWHHFRDTDRPGLWTRAGARPAHRDHGPATLDRGEIMHSRTMRVALAVCASLALAVILTFLAVRRREPGTEPAAAPARADSASPKTASDSAPPSQPPQPGWILVGGVWRPPTDVAEATARSTGAAENPPADAPYHP